MDAVAVGAHDCPGTMSSLAVDESALLGKQLMADITILWQSASPDRGGGH